MDNWTFKITDVGRVVQLSVANGKVGKLVIGGDGTNVFGLTERVGDLDGPEQDLTIPDCYTIGPGQYDLKAKTLTAAVPVSFNEP